MVWAGLGLYALAVIMVLFAPSSPSAAVDAITRVIRDDLGLSFVRQGWVEFAGNVVMFAPLGFLSTLLFRRPWWGMMIALALSVLAEVTQLLLPARTATLRDVVANGLGALIGALLAWLIVIRQSRRRRQPATMRAR